MLMSSSRRLLHEVYKAFNARDVAAVLERMHPDVDWPNGMEGGRVHGHSGVREYWQRQWKLIDPHVEPIAVEADASGLEVVTVHQIVRDLTGQVLMDRMVQHVYLIEAGLIQRMDIREMEKASEIAAG
jgi:ketosteroid isomerase-like protein